MNQGAYFDLEDILCEEQASVMIRMMHIVDNPHVIRPSVD